MTYICNHMFVVVEMKILEEKIKNFHVRIFCDGQKARREVWSAWLVVIVAMYINHVRATSRRKNLRE